MNNCPMMLNVVTQKSLYLQIKEWFASKNIEVEILDEGDELEMISLQEPSTEVVSSLKEFVTKLVEENPQDVAYDDEGDVQSMVDGASYLILYPERDPRYAQEIQVYSW